MKDKIDRVEKLASMAGAMVSDKRQAFAAEASAELQLLTALVDLVSSVLPEISDATVLGFEGAAMRSEWKGIRIGMKERHDAGELCGERSVYLVDDGTWRLVVTSFNDEGTADWTSEVSEIEPAKVLEEFDLPAVLAILEEKLDAYVNGRISMRIRQAKHYAQKVNALRTLLTDS